MSGRVQPKQAIDLPSWLAYAYAPIVPYLKNVISLRRAGSRAYSPKDILLPQGYTAEIVASDFNTPVHCCFDAEGACYVAEGGHKVEARPRILKVDTRTGEYTTFFQFPPDRWMQTG